MGDPTAELLGAIVNAGKTAWDIVKDNKAQSGASSSFCSAVPKKLKFTELSGWKTKTGKWKFIRQTGFGNNAVEVELVYSFDYNGSTAKVPGAKFLNNFTCYAKSTDVSWGYEVNINATVKGNPINVGTLKAPIGAVPLLVTASSKTLIRANSDTWLLQARGDGKLVVK